MSQLRIHDLGDLPGLDHEEAKSTLRDLFRALEHPDPYAHALDVFTSLLDGNPQVISHLDVEPPPAFVAAYERLTGMGVPPELVEVNDCCF